MIAGFEFKRPFAKSRLGRCLVWGWVLVLLLVPVHGTLSVWLGSNINSYLMTRSWKEALILLLLATALIFLTRNDPKTLRTIADRPINQLIIGYTLLHFVLSWFGPNLEAVLFGLVYNLRFLGFFLLAQVIGHYWRRSDDNEDKLNRLVLIPAAVVVGFGLLQILVLPIDFLTYLGYGPDTIEPFTTIDNKSDWVRIASFTRGANQLGQYLILPLILMGALWLKRRGWQMTLGMATGLAVMVGTYSRSAWLGLLAATISYLAMSADWRRHGRQIAIGAGAVLLLIAGLVYVTPNSQSLRLIIFHDDQVATDTRSSDEVRLDHTASSLEDIVSNPLGGGPGAAGPASFHNDAGHRINDNYYLQLALEIGWLGLIAFAIICWQAFKNLWSQKDQIWPRVLIASFIGLALVNLLLPAWANEETALIWWGLAGLWYKD